MKMNISSAHKLIVVIVYFCILRGTNATDKMERHTPTESESDAEVASTLAMYVAMATSARCVTQCISYVESSQRTTISTDIYRKAMEKCISFGDINSAVIEMIDRMEELHIPFDVKTHQFLHQTFVTLPITGIAKAVKLTASCKTSACVIRILRPANDALLSKIRLVKSDYHVMEVIYGVPLQRCVSLGDGIAANEVFRMMRATGYIPTRQLNDILLSGISVSPDFTAMDQWRFTEQVAGLGIVPPPERGAFGPSAARNVENIFVALIDFFEPVSLNDRRWDRTRNIMDLLGKYRTATSKHTSHAEHRFYHRAMETLAIREGNADARRVIKLAELMGKRRTLETYHMLFSAFVSDGSAYYALVVPQYVRQMVTVDQIAPTEETLMKVLSVFEGTGYIVEAERAVLCLTELSGVTLTEAASAVLRRIFLETYISEEEQDRLAAEDRLADDFVVSSLEHCRRLRDVSGAKEEFGSMREAGFVPSVKAYNLLLSTLSVSTEFKKEQRQYFEQMIADGIKPNEETLIALLEMWKNSDGSDSASVAWNVRDIWKELTGLGVAPSVGTQFMVEVLLLRHDSSDSDEEIVCRNK